MDYLFLRFCENIFSIIFENPFTYQYILVDNCALFDNKLSKKIRIAIIGRN